MRNTLIPTIVILLGLAGCGDLTTTQQRTMTGGIGGAAGGAVPVRSRAMPAWARVGAGAGAAGGYLYDQHKRASSGPTSVACRQAAEQYAGSRPSGRYPLPQMRCHHPARRAQPPPA